MTTNTSTTEKSSIINVFVLTEVNYCFNNHGSVKNVFFEKSKGLKRLIQMLDTDYTKESISTDKCLSYGNGDTSISLLRLPLSASKETKYLAYLHNKHNLPKEILLEINKYLYSDLWIVSFNHNYEVENPVRAISDNEEEASVIHESSDKKVIKIGTNNIII